MYPIPELKAQLDSDYRKWLDFDEREHQTYLIELDQVDDYLNSIQAPSSVRAYDKSVFAQNVDPNQPKVDAYYVVINQFVQSHEHVLGEFSKAKMIATLNSRGRKDRGKEKALSRAMKYIEDRNRSFTRVIFPSIDFMLQGGLGWAKISPDPYTNPPNGWINECYLDPRDVIIDANRKDIFFEDTRRRWHRMIYELSEAQAEFGNIEGFDATLLKADSEEDLARMGRTFDKARNPTAIYFCETTKRENFYKKIVGSEIHIITPDEYAAEQKEKNPNVFVDRAYVWYWAYYNRSSGVFWYKKSPIQTWSLIPLINRCSPKRVYPVGDFIGYKNLQDLFNVIISIILADVNESRKYLVAVPPDMYQMYADKIQKALEEGFGVIPSNQANMLEPHGVRQEVIMLLNFVKNALDNLQSMPSVSRGELPAKQIATETVSALMASARISHGRKDMMINYFVTELAKARLMMTAALWTEPDFIRITDDEPGSPDYVPINKVIIGRDPYLAFLGSMVGLDFEKEGQIPPEVAQNFMAFVKQFEAQNSVQTEEKVFHRYANEDGRLRSDEELEQDVKESGLTPEAFVEMHGVTLENIPVYTINKFGPDPDVDVSYILDFEIEKNKQRKQALALEAGKIGWSDPVTTMRELEMDDPQGRFDRAQALNRTVQLAKQIESDPKFQQAIQVAQSIVDNPKLFEIVKQAAASMTQGGNNAA